MWGVAYRLDAMTVGIEHECAIVVGVISGPKPRRTIADMKRFSATDDL
jgi:hypothetical protein